MDYSNHENDNDDDFYNEVTNTVYYALLTEALCMHFELILRITL